MPEQIPQGYAIQFYFDSATEKQIFDFRNSLYERGLTRKLGNMGDRPHVTLAVMPPEKLDVLKNVVQDFASTLKSFPVELAAMGTFPSTENVFYLSPIPTQQLIKIHQSFHKILQKEKIEPSPYYIPDHWMPHCTLEIELSNVQLVNAFQLAASSFSPIHGAFASLGMISFRPIIYISESRLS